MPSNLIFKEKKGWTYIYTDYFMEHKQNLLSLDKSSPGSYEDVLNLTFSIFSCQIDQLWENSSVQGSDPRLWDGDGVDLGNISGGR